MIFFQSIIEAAILKKKETGSNLKEACFYALEGGGKRFRPALVLMVAKALKNSFDVMDSALAIEYFHTASLIADDLPCMDNDEVRRKKAATHVKYGEATALLASYALIAEGYKLIADNAFLLAKERVENAHLIGSLAIENASLNTAMATEGQYIDLFPPKIDRETYLETVLKKTVALFEISFVFGWLFGGGNLNELENVKKLAYHYGMAFQIADDFDDFKEDFKEERMMNAVSLFGKKEAFKMFSDEIDSYLKILKNLKIDSEDLINIAEFLILQLKPIH